MVGTTFDTATTALCSKLIERAENEVNKYLSKRYEIDTFAVAVPPIVTTLTEQLTEGYMYMSMARGSRDSMKRANEMLKYPLENLQMIADYKSDVLDSSGNPLPESTDSPYRILSTTDNYTPTFAEDDELGWEVDELKLDDISSDRSRNG